jgi:hypothetical protein
LNFGLFQQSITSPDLKIIAAHWDEARGTRLMPAWNDIRPSAIARQLPIVWCYVYDPVDDEFTGKLAGEAMTRIFGKSLKGVRMSELQTAFDYPRLFTRAKRVVCEPAVFHGHGLVFKQQEQYGHGESVMLPLSTDGVNGDAMLGGTDFKLEKHPLFDTDNIVEVEDWCSLKLRDVS